MLRKEKFVQGEHYHIYNRVIFNMPEFRDDTNAKRLLQAFLLANSTNSSLAFDYLRTSKNPLFETALEIAEGGDKLVDVLCYAIMPDHYHLLLREKLEGGITSFVHRCNISIAKYINIKNDRKGSLFDGPFSSKYVGTNEYLLHLSLYIHLNPLDFLTGKEWREHKIKNWSVAKKELLNYPYSSLKYFLDNKHEDKIISGTEIIKEQFKDPKEYESFLKEWSEEEQTLIGDCIID